VIATASGGNRPPAREGRGTHPPTFGQDGGTAGTVPEDATPSPNTMNETCNGYCGLPIPAEAPRIFLNGGEAWCRPCFHVHRAATLAARGEHEAAARCVYGE